jgi:hypothetical protein
MTLDMKEIKERIYKGKGKYGHAWLLLKAGIVRIVDVKMESDSLANDAWVTMKFNYWNPLTYIYIAYMCVTNVLPAYYIYGFKSALKSEKDDMKEGFGIIIY